MCSCYNWIDKRCHYSRWLQLDSVVQGGKAAPACSPLSWQHGAQSSSGTGYAPISPTYAGRNTAQSPMCPSGSPTRFAAQQQLQQARAASSPQLAKALLQPGERPGSPVQYRHAWQQQQQQQQAYGSPPGLYSNSGSVPSSPLIRAARPHPAACML